MDIPEIDHHLAFFLSEGNYYHAIQGCKDKGLKLYEFDSSVKDIVIKYINKHIKNPSHYIVGITRMYWSKLNSTGFKTGNTHNILISRKHCNSLIYFTDTVMEPTELVTLDLFTDIEG